MLYRLAGSIRRFRMLTSGEVFLLELLGGGLHTRAMMNPWSLVAALAVVSLSSCGLSSEKKAVIARAGSIHEFPVPRATLVATLGLGDQRGERRDVTIRGRMVSSSETWQHPAGLTIAAYDTTLDRRQIGEVLLGRTQEEPASPEEPGMPSLPGEDEMPGLPGEPEMPSPAPASVSFDRFVVKDGTKVLYRSDEAGREAARKLSQ